MGHGIGKVGNKGGNTSELAAGDLNITHEGTVCFLSLSLLLVFTGAGSGKVAPVAPVAPLLVAGDIISDKVERKPSLSAHLYFIRPSSVRILSKQVSHITTSARWGARRAQRARFRVAQIMQVTRV